MTATPDRSTRPSDGRDRRAPSAPDRRAAPRRTAPASAGLHRVLRRVRLGGRDLEPVRQLVLLAPAHRRVHPRPRHPAPRRLLVHRARHAVGRAVVARRGHLRRARTASFGAFGVRLLRRRRRCRHRHARVPPRAAARARPRRARAASRSPRSPGSTPCGRSGRCSIGVLFLLVLLWVVEVPDSFVGRHPLVVLPVLFWLWANVHGSFALGFAYLGLHLLGRWLDGAPPWDGRERRLLARRARSRSRSMFVNPYGAELVMFPIALLSRGDILSHIVEWRSPDFRQIYGLALALDRGVRRRAGARSQPRLAPRPGRDGADAAPRAVGAPQRRDRAAGRPAGRRPGVRPRRRSALPERGARSSSARSPCRRSSRLVIGLPASQQRTSSSRPTR